MEEKEPINSINNISNNDDSDANEIIELKREQAFATLLFELKLSNYIIFNTSNILIRFKQKYK